MLSSIDGEAGCAALLESIDEEAGGVASWLAGLFAAFFSGALTFSSALIAAVLNASMATPPWITALAAG